MWNAHHACNSFNSFSDFLRLLHPQIFFSLLLLFSWMRSAHTCVSDRGFNECHSFFRLLHPLMLFCAYVWWLGQSAETRVSNLGFNEFYASLRLLHTTGLVEAVVFLFVSMDAKRSCTNITDHIFSNFMHFWDCCRANLLLAVMFSFVYLIIY